MNFKFSLSGIVTFIGASIDKYLLNTAIEHGDAHLVERMILKGVNFELEDNQGRRAIHRACEIGNVDIVEVLIRHRCKLESRTKSGQTPLHITCNNGYIDVLKLLIAKNCELEPKDHAFSTPLELATRSGNRLCALHLCQAIEARNNALRMSTASPSTHKESTLKLCKLKIKKLFQWPRQSKKVYKQMSTNDADNERTICPVCMVNERDCSFDCGHTFCITCGMKVNICPMCRATPTNPRKIII